MQKFLAPAFASLALLAASAAPAAAQVQWNYTFQPSGQALASYLGDVSVVGLTSLANVSITGTCAGCASASLATPNTWTATQTFAAPSTTSAVVDNIVEPTVVSGSAPIASNTFDVLSSSVQLFTGNATTNWTLNIRGNSVVALNTMLNVGQTVTIAYLVTQGVTPFFNNVVQIDGVTVTPKWQSGAPSAGNASGIDAYTYSVTKTAAATYVVLASQVQFK